MAHIDGRRSPLERQPDGHSPQHHDFPESRTNASPPKQPQSRPIPQQANYSQPRSRASSSRSDASSQQSQILPQPEPINDAVSYAFDKSDAAHKVDPGLVAQITEQVINSLKASGFHGVSHSQQNSTQPPPPPPTSQHQQQSYQSTRPNRRYSYTPRSPTSNETPPSPNKFDRYSSFGSDSADSPMEDPQRKESLTSRKPRERMPSPPSNLDGTSERRDSRNSHRPSIGEEETTLEKCWQPLFDEEDRPTMRLSSFLRGLAIHLIEDFEPKHSVVITPTKMLKFYELSRVTEERYSYPSIFSKIPKSAISRIYRELRCQHHLVQHAHHEVPTIPGLTTWGFETWLTTMIRAHPETEFERLAKCVREMPISNADHRSERFPKELSRRLFPKKEDPALQQRLATAMAADNAIPPPQYRNNPPNFPPPPPSISSNTTASSFTERERTPYAGTSKAASAASAESSFDEDSRSTASFQSASSVPIERERKPYTAQVGAGKVYDEDIIGSLHQNGPPRHNSTGPLPPMGGGYAAGSEQSSFHPTSTFPSHTATPTQKVPNPVQQSVPNRSQSVRAEATMRPLHRETTQPSVSAAHGSFAAQSAGIDIPPPPPGTGRQYRTNSTVGGRRPRSPSFAAGTGQPPLGTSLPGARQNTFARSEGNMSEIPPNWYASNLHNDNAIDDDDPRPPPMNPNGPGFGSGPGGMGRKAGVRGHAQTLAADGIGVYGGSPGGPPPPPPMTTGSVPPGAMGRDRSATAGVPGASMGAPGMMGMDGRPGANGYEGRGSAYDDDYPRRPNSNYFPPPPTSTRY